MTPKKLLIVGVGSVGKRHARNFSALGIAIGGVDPRADRAAELAGEVAGAASYRDIGEALANDRFDGVVICSPPAAHGEQVRLCIEAGLPVLLEKPVSPDLPTAEALVALQQKRNVPVLLGYTWRWWPPLQRIRELLSSAVLGQLRHVRFVMSAHLADWHPWEKYQDFFMASRAQGGGALLDESHWIDLSCWLFGMPDFVSGSVEKISRLEIDSDDNVDLQLFLGQDLRVTLHLDLFGRPHEKSITFVGDTGTLRWTAEPNEFVIGRSAGAWEHREPFNCGRNDMFVAVAKDFVRVLSGAPPTCTLADGVNVLRIVEAARLSHDSGRRIRILSPTP